MFSKACLQALVSVIMNTEEIKNKWKTRLIWTKGMFTGYHFLWIEFNMLRLEVNKNDSLILIEQNGNDTLNLI